MLYNSHKRPHNIHMSISNSIFALLPSLSVQSAEVVLCTPYLYDILNTIAIALYYRSGICLYGERFMA